MADSTTTDPIKRPGCGRRRLLAAGSAVLAALVAYFVETKLLGLELIAPAVGNRESFPIDANTVFTVSLVTAVLAWFGIAALEGIRPTARRARPIWTVIASLAFLVSLAGPFAGTGVETSGRLGLAALHVVVAGILIPLIPDWPPRSERVRVTAG